MGKPQVSGGNPPTCNKEGDSLITHNRWVLRRSEVLNYALVRAIVQDFHGGDPQGEVSVIHLCPVHVPLVLGDLLPLCVSKYYLHGVLLPVDTVIMQAIRAFNFMTTRQANFFPEFAFDFLL